MVVKFPVIAVNVFINAVAKAKIFPVKFVTVVDANVEEPTAKKLLAASIPVFVEDPIFNELNAPVWAIKLVRVVLAKVVEPAVKFVIE